MSRSRILTSIAAATLGVALFGACSAESLTERAVGFGLEQAIEGDQDIDLDFSDDGTGGFSISTEEGDFAINFDEDNGGIVFNTDEGSGVVSFDEDGIVYETDEGSGVVSFDEDNGSITYDTDQGSGEINVDEDNGGVTFTNEDGEVGFIGATDIPDDWPASVGVPASLVPGTASFTVLDMGNGMKMTTAGFEHAENEPFAANAIAGLQADGWETTMSSNDGGSVFAMFTKGAVVAQITGDGGYTTVTFMDQ